MAKKTTKTTKKSTPRVTKKVEITEKQYSESVVNEVDSSINETEKVSVDLNELEKYKTSENEYDMTKASSEEVTTMIDNLKDDDEVILKKDDEIELNQEDLDELKKVSGVKEDFKEEVDQDQPLEVMNGDPTVVTTIDKIEEEAMAETFKENKKKRLIDNMIGYSWNGQEIDYIL